MREIKFRAYDKLEKRMRKVVSLHWQDDKLVAVKVDGEAEPLPIDGRFIIEQYTGLKDSSGKEIYENDILKTQHHEWIDHERYQVKYCELGFDLSPEIDSEVNGLSLFIVSDCYTAKVIGNAHENQELMEERI